MENIFLVNVTHLSVDKTYASQFRLWGMGWLSELHHPPLMIIYELFRHIITKVIVLLSNLGLCTQFYYILSQTIDNDFL